MVIWLFDNVHGCFDKKTHTHMMITMMKYIIYIYIYINMIVHKCMIYMMLYIICGYLYDIVIYYKCM